MGHYVYKYVLNNEIIYIGKTDTFLKNRISQHGKPGDNIPKEAWEDINNSDVYYITLNNSTMSDVVESELIRRYKPRYNVAKTSEWSGLPFPEPEWVKYDQQLQADPIEKKAVKKEKTNQKEKYIARVKEAFEYNADARRLLPYLISRISNGQYRVFQPSLFPTLFAVEAPEGFDKDCSLGACYLDDKRICFDSYITCVKFHDVEGVHLAISLETDLDQIITCCGYVCKNMQQYCEISEMPLDEEYINTMYRNIEKLKELQLSIGI